jgi:hypothetical protein
MRISSAVITVAPIGLNAGSFAKREAVTTTGGSVLPLFVWANAGAMMHADKAEASASGFHAGARLVRIGKIMMSLQIRIRQSASPQAGINGTACSRSSTYFGRYPG